MEAMSLPAPTKVKDEIITGSNGRGVNRFGLIRTNPLATRVMMLRAALITAVDNEDIQLLMRKLIDMGLQGNIEAIKEVFNRAVGKPVEHDLIDQIARLEGAVQELTGGDKTQVFVMDHDTNTLVKQEVDKAGEDTLTPVISEDDLEAMDLDPEQEQT